MLAEEYAPPFAFTGTIKKALVDVSGELVESKEAQIRMYLARQ
jgi:arylsulfatase